MKGNDTYGPTPLKLEAFANTESITGVITDVVKKNFDGRERWVITIDDEWTLVINDTNYRSVKKVYGEESSDWLHRPIVAYKGTLYYRGQEQDGICVRVPEEETPAPLPAKKIEAANAELHELGAELKDDIPF